MGVATLPWNEFYARMRWEQGEHVSLIGPTGHGKTTVGDALMLRRKYVTVLALKPADTTLDNLYQHGFEKVVTWPPPAGVNRVLLWPLYRGPEDRPHQAEIMRKALLGMFHDGGWTCFADELRRLTSMGLGPILEEWWQQGRSVLLSLVAGMQRPAWVPLAAYSQVTHLFLWRNRDEGDLKRISEMAAGVLPRKELVQIISTLGFYEFLYVDTARDWVVKSQWEPPGQPVARHRTATQAPAAGKTLGKFLTRRWP